MRVQRHEIDVAEGELLALGHADHADEMGHRRQQFRRVAEQRLRARADRQLLPQARQLAFGQRLDLQQRVDEHAIALRRRDAPGGGVRRGQQADLLQVGEDVADGGRADVEARVARQRLRTDRLAVADVARDQRAQQLACARVEVGVGRT